MTLCHIGERVASEAATRGVLSKKYSEKIREFHRKTGRLFY